MFYVIYVLAILCGTALGLKMHSPSMGMVVAKRDVTIRWSREAASDPTSVLILLENLASHEKIPGDVSNLLDSGPDTTAQMKFPEVGTFRMWAVNPANPSQPYAKSKHFKVIPNNVAASAEADGDSVGGDTSASAYANSDGTLSPPDPVSSDSGSAVSSLSSAPSAVSTSPSLAATSDTTSVKKMMPYLIGGIIGGVVFLLLLGALIYVLLRRRARVVRRTTFHRNRMVKSLPPPTFAPHDPELDSPGFSKPEAARYISGVRYMEERPRPPTGPYPFARTA